MTISKIRGITVGSDYDYIIYGIARGLVAETDDHQAAVEALVADAKECESQGVISDVSVYEATESGWRRMGYRVRNDGSVYDREQGQMEGLAK